MKTLFGFLTLIFLSVAFTPNVQAQQEDKKVTVNASDLTAEQLAKIEADKVIAFKNQQIADLQKKAETYGKWVGVGGEIGTAVKEGLTAVVDVADKFGKTDVGKFTLVMVAWKVVGKDITKIVLGLLFLIAFIWILIYSFRRTCVSKRVLIENPGFFKYPKKYEVIPPAWEEDGLGLMVAVHIVAFFLAVWITYAIMF